ICRVHIPVWFRGTKIGHFEADVLVENCVLLELKAARTLDSAHRAQLLNYLRATEIEVGLLLNFGEKPEFNRLIFDNLKKRSH
ncbi:MAG TPA: GxxExxY protein, partial [Pyrinomonadaceae bacterium]